MWRWVRVPCRCLRMSERCWLPWSWSCKPLGATGYGCWELTTGPLQSHWDISSPRIFISKRLLYWTAWLWLFVPSWGTGKVTWLQFTQCPEAMKVQSPGADRKQRSPRQHMACALQDKKDGCVTRIPFPLASPPPPTLTASSGEGGLHSQAWLLSSSIYHDFYFPISNLASCGWKWNHQSTSPSTLLCLLIYKEPLPGSRLSSSPMVTCNASKSQGIDIVHDLFLSTGNKYQLVSLDLEENNSLLFFFFFLETILNVKEQFLKQQLKLWPLTRLLGARNIY